MKGKFGGRFALLLVALVLDLLSSPFLENHQLGRVLFNIFSSVVLLSALYSVSDSKRSMIIGTALWVPAIVGVWMSLLAPTFSTLAGAPVLVTFFFIYTAFRILRHVSQAEEVTSEVIYGALCVYLLLGYIWGMFYFGLETYQPGSFRMNPGSSPSEGLVSHCVYFSYVTLTTLGYGDFSPLSAGARALAMVEALVGQLFLAVLVARLVGMHIAHSMKK